MLKSFIFLFIASSLGYAIARYGARPDRPVSDGSELPGTVSVGLRRGALVPLSALAVVFIVQLLVRMLRDDPEGFWTYFWIEVGVLSSMAFVVALFLRRFVFSSEGVVVRSVVSLRYSWNELTMIEAIDQGGVAILKFHFGTKKIVVDSNMIGFQALLRALDVFPSEHAKSIIERATRTLAKWRQPIAEKA